MLVNWQMLLKVLASVGVAEAKYAYVPEGQHSISALGHYLSSLKRGAAPAAVPGLRYSHLLVGT